MSDQNLADWRKLAVKLEAEINKWGPVIRKAGAYAD